MAGVSVDPKHRTIGTIYFRQRGIIAIIVITDTLQPMRWMHFDFYNFFFFYPSVYHKAVYAGLTASAIGTYEDICVTAHQKQMRRT